MLRTILGFAIFAVLFWIGLSFVFGLLGIVVSVAVKLLSLAALGFVFYLLLRLISPSTADRLRDIIKGRAADA